MCCGHGRKQSTASYSTQNRSPQTRSSQMSPTTPSPAGAQTGSLFEYVGNTGLTVVGPATGARYRFERPGARMQVDLRDHVGLARIPVLRHVG